jgi:hypothetical protein
LHYLKLFESKYGCTPGEFKDKIKQEKIVESNELSLDDVLRVIEEKLRCATRYETRNAL